jgi:hypothetical protein
MNFWRYWLTNVIVAAALQGIAPAQAQDSPPRSPIPQQCECAPPVLSLISIPVPYDPAESVLGGAQLVHDAAERAAIIDMLQKSQHLSNVRLHAYDLKTSFTSYGSSSSDGRWILEDMSPGTDVYRWTAQGPSYSAVFLTSKKLLSSSQPGGAVPLRLAQVRSAIFGAFFPGIGPLATLRAADGNVGGAALKCVLIAVNIPAGTQPEFASGRSFGESEYCIDPKTLLLELYSPAPGIYIHYDYANAQHFHDTIIGGGFTITEGGKTIIEARTDSVSDAPPPNSNLFEPTGLHTLGAGIVAEVPTLVRGIGGAPGSSAQSSKTEVVVVHGVLSPDGKLDEPEIIASTNPSFNQAAIDRTARAPTLQNGTFVQPGAVQHTREIIFTEEFRPSPVALSQNRAVAPAIGELPLEVRVAPGVGVSPGSVNPGPATLPYNSGGSSALPYSAIRENETVRTLSDGTHIVTKSQTRMYRDSQGRTRTEVFPPPEIASATGSQEPMIITIMDPVEGVQYSLNPRNHSGTRNVLRARPAVPPQPVPRPPVNVTPPPRPPDELRPQTTSEDLGMQTIGGVSAHGTRMTTTVPVNAQGNDRPLVTVFERWYSDEFRMDIRTKRSDPRNGETTENVTIDRTEPDPSLFRPPADYAITEPQHQ